VLAGISGLHVAARSSAFQFRGAERDVREIGNILGVGKIVEGSVRKADARLRITVQLIDVADGYQLWSERYDRTVMDIFAQQDEIVTAICTALLTRLTLTGQETGPHSGRQAEPARELSPCVSVLEDEGHRLALTAASSASTLGP
jgi:serine/threonine-protein kinase